MTRKALLLPGEVLNQKYVVEREIGSGGMGRIYLAKQKPFERLMALKVMHPEHSSSETLSHRFFQEAQMISRLTHPNTVTVFDFGQTAEDLFYIAMEYVPGTSLGKLLRREGPLGIEEAVPFTIQVAQSLGEAHYNGIIHRDLKPDNIIVCRPPSGDAFVKVVDFGIAKLLERDAGWTQAGNIVGTPLYMSPEQGKDQEIDGRSDLYALACCLYEMLCGRPPYLGTSPLALLMEHQNAPIPDLPQAFPQALNRFMRRGLAKLPADRPPDAATFVAELMAAFLAEVEEGPRRVGRESDHLDIIRRTPLPRKPTRLTPFDSDSVSQQGEFTDPAKANEDSKPSASKPGASAWGELQSPRDEEGQALRPTVLQQTPSSVEQTHSSPIPFYARFASKSPIPRSSVPGPSPNEPEGASDPIARNSSTPHSQSDRRSAPGSSQGPAPVSPESREAQQPSLDAQQNAAFESQHLDFPVGKQGEFGLRIALVLPMLAVIGWLAWFGNDRLFAPDTVAIDLLSNPSAAVVRIDDQPIGETPLTQEIRANQVYDVKFEKEGFVTSEFPQFSIEEGGSTRLYAKLKPRIDMLSIQTPLPKTEIFVNGKSYGLLSPGHRRQIEFVAAGDKAVVFTFRHPQHEDLILRIPRQRLQKNPEIHPDVEEFVPKK